MISLLNQYPVRPQHMGFMTHGFVSRYWQVTWNLQFHQNSVCLGHNRSIFIFRLSINLQLNNMGEHGRWAESETSGFALRATTRHVWLFEDHYMVWHRTQHKRNLLKTCSLFFRWVVDRLALFGVTPAYVRVSDTETRLIFQADATPNWSFLEKRINGNSKFRDTITIFTNNILVFCNWPIKKTR